MVVQGMCHTLQGQLVHTVCKMIYWLPHVHENKFKLGCKHATLQGVELGHCLCGAGAAAIYQSLCMPFMRSCEGARVTHIQEGSLIQCPKDAIRCCNDGGRTRSIEQQCRVSKHPAWMLGDVCFIPLHSLSCFGAIACTTCSDKSLS